MKLLRRRQRPEDLLGLAAQCVQDCLESPEHPDIALFILEGQLIGFGYTPEQAGRIVMRVQRPC